MFEEITGIEISVEYDDDGEFHHHSYCMSIDDAIEILMQMKKEFNIE